MTSKPIRATLRRMKPGTLWINKPGTDAIKIGVNFGEAAAYRINSVLPRSLQEMLNECEWYLVKAVEVPND